MRIVILNDDGIYSDGIKALALKMKELGDVTVVAPRFHQSGAGHSITIEKKIKVEKIDFAEGIEGYAVHGLPRDCAELAINAIIKEPIDLLVSGINKGNNLSSNVPCSGTCGAACAGLDFGIPAIAVSLDFGKTYDWDYAAEATLKVAKWFVNQPFKHEFVISINVPNMDKENIKGYAVCGYGGIFKFEQNLEPEFDGQYYYYDVTSTNMYFDKIVESMDGDIYAMSQGYITLSPIHLDMVRYQSMNDLKKFLG